MSLSRSSHIFFQWILFEDIFSFLRIFLWCFSSFYRTLFLRKCLFSPFSRQLLVLMHKSCKELMWLLQQNYWTMLLPLGFIFGKFYEFARFYLPLLYIFHLISLNISRPLIVLPFHSSWLFIPLMKVKLVPLFMTTKYNEFSHSSVRFCPNIEDFEFSSPARMT